MGTDRASASGVEGLYGQADARASAAGGGRDLPLPHRYRLAGSASGVRPVADSVEAAPSFLHRWHLGQGPDRAAGPGRRAARSTGGSVSTPPSPGSTSTGRPPRGPPGRRCRTQGGTTELAVARAADPRWARTARASSAWSTGLLVSTRSTGVSVSR